MVSGASLLAALKTASLRKVTAAGHELHVRGLSGAERKLLADRARDGNPVQPYELVGLCACDEQGGALFTAEQAAELANADGAAVEQIATAILAASGLVEGAAEAAGKN